MAARVALVHDFLLDLRGAERVFAAMCEAWPDADVFTAVYDEEGTEGRFADRHPQTSFLQRLRPTARTFRPLLPLYPHAIESFDLRAYDAVVSSSSAWAHGVLVDPGAVHVCYCHNPFRYAWTEREADAARAPAAVCGSPLRVLLNRWRQWDWIAAQRVDRYVANSHLTAARVAALLRPRGRPCCTRPWRPGASPPRPRVGDGLHRPGGADGAQAHRRRRAGLQRAAAAARRRRRRARAAAPAPARGADGDVHRPGRRRAGRRAPGRSRALVVTATEEFGIAAVEALAAGRPVIALGEGGVRESVTEGVTGTFYAPQRARGARRGGAPLRRAGRGSRAPAAPPPSGSAPRGSAPSCGGSWTRRWTRTRPRPEERPATAASRGSRAGVRTAPRRTCCVSRFAADFLKVP